MSYLIYDESGELVDVLEFDSPEELESYKQLNPQFVVDSTNTSVEPLFEDDEYIEEDDYFEDDDITLVLW